MTTWTNTAINRTKTGCLGPLIVRTYVINGASGDTGGTLTCNGFKQISGYAVGAIHTAALGSLAHYRNSATSNTIVVTYSDPTATHKVCIVVWGLKA